MFSHKIRRIVSERYDYFCVALFVLQSGIARWQINVPEFAQFRQRIAEMEKKNEWREQHQKMLIVKKKLCSLV